jgi:hypothetical protein
MLQYAVDTQLDRLLADVWLRVTEPPMLQNPYPRLMHFLRSASGTGCLMALAAGDVRALGCAAGHRCSQWILARPAAAAYTPAPATCSSPCRPYPAVLALCPLL